MPNLKNLTIASLTSPRSWAVAFILSALLATLGLMLDRQIQSNHFEHTTSEFKAEINQLLLNAASDVNRIQMATFEPTAYLADLAAESSLSTLVTEYYFINDDGTFYAGSQGNPHQQYLVTVDDLDHAALPMSLKETDMWRYHFLHAQAASTFLWPSPLTPDHWFITVHVVTDGSTEHHLVGFEIPAQSFASKHATHHLAYQFSSERPTPFAGEQMAKAYSLKASLTSRLNLLGEWTFPWLAWLLPIVGLMLLLLFVWLPNHRVKPSSTSRWKELQGTLCEELNVILFETDAHSKINWLAGQFTEGTVFSDLHLGVSVKALLKDHPKYISYWQHSLDGEKFAYEMQNHQNCLRVHQWPVLDHLGSVIAIRVMVQNITHLRALELQLQHQQLHDTLTGLPNRHVFIEQLTHELHRAKRRQEFLAVIAIEISGIGDVNKQFGHKTSDDLLKLISKNMSHTLRSEDTLCRFSNDEFLICFNDYHQPDELQLIAERIIDKASARLEVNGQWVNFFANIGIATYPRDALDAGSLISNAITAMRHARKTGRNTLDYFSADNARVAHEKWQLEQDISKALTTHDFTLNYQPIFDLTTNKCIGAEALIRWPGTDLSPDQFIPLAEETGLIHSIGFWVLETALTQFKQWRQEGGNIAYMSVNLSVVQLKENEFFTKLDAILQRLPFEPGSVVLELTESVMLNTNKVMLKKLQALRDRGFHLAIDDFGTGFSSLNYLKHLPINYLKVDRSFVDGIPDNTHDTVICEAIINMAIAMDLQIIAEGVETPGQLAWISSKGVLYAQGYFYAQAVPAVDFKPYIGIR